jgi:PAS domain S-box-containing protein
LPKVPGLTTAIALALLAALALAVNAALAISNVRSMSQASALVSHSHHVLEQVQAVLSSLQDAETGQRGFLLTGDVQYLPPYESGRDAVQEHLGQLLVLTRDNAAEQATIESMRPLVLAKLEELGRTVALRRESPEGAEAARAIVNEGEGKKLMDELRVKVAEMFEHEDPILDERVRTAAGAARTAIATSLIGFGASLGLLAGAVFALRNRVRERERAAGQLSAEKERFRTTLRSIGDAVIVTDTEGRITLLNPTAQSILLWDEGALGRPLHEVFPIVNEDTRQPVESPVAKVLRDGQVVGLANHTIVIRRDGSTVPIDDSGAPVRDATGRMVGVVLVFRDIAERRAAERELERSAQLLKEQDQRKDAFLGILSHELRNPLAPIRNAVAVLQRVDPAGEQAQRAREVIDRQVAQLARLVDDLLDLSRITEGKIRLAKEQFSLREAVRRAVDDHRGLFHRKSIALDCHDAADPIWVEADAHRIAQVLGNLLQNAAKFTNPDGRVEVTLESDGTSALLAVSDDGAGMDAATLGKLFQPFMQAEDTLARTRGGLGLGLALTKSLVELHGGRIEASSAGVGLGSAFVVTLPLAGSAALPRPDAPAAAPKPLRVLIVEDNEDAASTLCEVLALDGHQVSVAATGLAGVDAALRDRPDVVLCDIGLPEIDGYEVARRLRRAGVQSLLVALTGYATPEDVARARAAGFDAHLAKPPDLARLAVILAAKSGAAPA